jgi:hypothetical protein
MVRALYSIKDTWARLGDISRKNLYPMLRARSLPSVVIGCRRFASAEAIATLISSYTTIIGEPSQDAVRSRQPLGNAAKALRSTPRVRIRSDESDAE